MKKIKNTVASVLLISMAVSGCSRPEEAVVTESSEETVATSSVNETVDNVHYVEDDLPYYDYDEPLPEQSERPTNGMVLRNELYVPLDEYEMVIGSIVDYISNGSPSYVGMEAYSGIDEMISMGDPLNSICYSFFDVDMDGIGELAVMTYDEYGYRILELYSYDRDYGIHKILSGDLQHKYYPSCFSTVYLISEENDYATFAEYFFGSDKVMYLSYCYYITPVYGVDHLCSTFVDSEIGMSPIDGAYVVDMGAVTDNACVETLTTYYENMTGEMNYFPRVVTLAEYAG